MRYSIMLQLVTGIGVILLMAASLFAWFQNRQPETESSFRDTTSLYDIS